MHVYMYLYINIYTYTYNIGSSIKLCKYFMPLKGQWKIKLHCNKRYLVKREPGAALASFEAKFAAFNKHVREAASKRAAEWSRSTKRTQPNGCVQQPTQTDGVQTATSRAGRQLSPTPKTSHIGHVRQSNKRKQAAAFNRAAWATGAGKG